MTNSVDQWTPSDYWRYIADHGQHEDRVRIPGTLHPDDVMDVYCAVRELLDRVVADNPWWFDRVLPSRDLPEVARWHWVRLRYPVESVVYQPSLVEARPIGDHGYLVRVFADVVRYSPYSPNPGCDAVYLEAQLGPHDRRSFPDVMKTWLQDTLGGTWEVPPWGVAFGARGLNTRHYAADEWSEWVKNASPWSWVDTPDGTRFTAEWRGYRCTVDGGAGGDARVWTVDACQPWYPVAGEQAKCSVWAVMSYMDDMVHREPVVPKWENIWETPATGQGGVWDTLRTRIKWEMTPVPDGVRRETSVNGHHVVVTTCADHASYQVFEGGPGTRVISENSGRVDRGSLPGDDPWAIEGARSDLNGLMEYGALWEALCAHETTWGDRAYVETTHGVPMDDVMAGRVTVETTIGDARTPVSVSVIPDGFQVRGGPAGAVEHVPLDADHMTRFNEVHHAVFGPRDYYTPTRGDRAPSIDQPTPGVVTPEITV